jgi:hypothetical protein
MNRKSIFIMLVVAFALIWQSNYGTTDIPQNYGEGSDNFHNFFDSLKDTMDRTGYTPAEFLQAARAVLEGFKNGGYFAKFTQYTDQGFQEAYEYVSANPTFVGFAQGEFTSADATTFQKFFIFIQTCFTSFSTMTPIQQINAFIQLSGLYICLEKLWVTTTGICTGIYNFGKLTITTFMNLYDALTATGTNPEPIPISITIPPVAAASAVTQVASPRTIGEVKKALDSILTQIPDPNNTTVAEGLIMINGSMSANEFRIFVNSTPNVNISDVQNYGNSTMPARSIFSGDPIGFPNSGINNIRRSRSVPKGWTPTKYITTTKNPTKFKGSDAANSFKKKLSENTGGRIKRTKRRKYSKKKTKRRKTNKRYKRRRSSSRKR